MKDLFDNTKTWKADVDRHVRTHKTLVGNKADLGDDRCIARGLAEVFSGVTRTKIVVRPTSRILHVWRA